MKAVEFCYWLQGFFELSTNTSGLSQEQSECIKKHLALVFKHEIDPSYPISQQEQLTEIHNGKTNLSSTSKHNNQVSGWTTDDDVFRC